MLNIQRIREYGVFIPTQEYLTYQGPSWKRVLKDCKILGSGWLQQSSLLQTLQGLCTHEFTEAVTVYTRPIQGPAGQYPIMDGGATQVIPHPAAELFSVVGYR